MAQLVNLSQDGSPLRLVCSAESGSLHPSLINKPLPPVPASQPPKSPILHELQPDLTRNELTPQFPLPPPPPPSTTLLDPGLVDCHRDPRSHKHHKHHKHRHRHKAKDVAAQTTDTLLDGHSMDSGRHTGTGGSSTDALLECSVHMSPPAQPRMHPPPPPPRGPSSLLSSRLGVDRESGDTSHISPKSSSNLRNHMPSMSVLLESTHSSGLKTKSPIRSLSDSVPSCGDLESPLNQPINVSLQSIPGEAIEGFFPIGPVSELSRPQSQHSYDMADHRSCGIPQGDISQPTTNDSEIAAVYADQTSVFTTAFTSSVVTSVVTTTMSSSTTGCSTATSGSAHSGSGSVNSLPGVRQASNGTETQSYGSGGRVRGGSFPSSRLPGDCRLSHGSEPTVKSTHSSGSDRHSRIPESCLSSGHVITDESTDLAHAPWYQPRVPREVALELLSLQPPGSFVIRDSGSHPNCYALSVRFGEGSGRCALSRKSPLPAVVRHGSNRESCMFPSYPHSLTGGISHFLIQRTTRGGVRLKGLDKEWPSLACLVLHLTVMPEMLPCPLRLPKAAANPAFSPVDKDGPIAGVGQPHFEQSPGLACSPFRPISDVTSPVGADGGLAVRAALSTTVEDEDYQRLSDFSSIMADLKMRPRAPAQAGAIRKGRV
ncbi:hypothetical protein P879_08299 [Paragonimus westermani]|uniref:SH2 domain-containing protein n=1 Tax=Paragonimus westermani TaxID=34504 RepID=A0A8T0DHI5_9TREM|nr:hypothetical protein P879_08299 [Paragonimus westermani]